MTFLAKSLLISNTWPSSTTCWMTPSMSYAWRASSAGGRGERSGDESRQARQERTKLAVPPLLGWVQVQPAASASLHTMQSTARHACERAAVVVALHLAGMMFRAHLQLIGGHHIVQEGAQAVGWVAAGHLHVQGRSRRG